MINKALLKLRENLISILKILLKMGIFSGSYSVKIQFTTYYMWYTSVICNGEL